MSGALYLGDVMTSFLLKVSKTSFMAALNVSRVRVASDIPSASVFKTTR